MTASMAENGEVRATRQHKPTQAVLHAKGSEHLSRSARARVDGRVDHAGNGVGVLAREEETPVDWLTHDLACIALVDRRRAVDTR